MMKEEEEKPYLKSGPGSTTDLEKTKESDSASPKRNAGSMCKDRDPNSLNSNVQVLWDDIIGEPEGLKTPDVWWNCSTKCYQKAREWCYLLLSILFAPLIALCIGCEFACVAFMQVWCAIPCLRLCKIKCGIVRKFWRGCLLTYMAPCAEVCSMCLYRIKVQHQSTSSDDYQKTDEDYFNV